MTSTLTMLIEDVITCSICQKHFDEPRMLSPCKHTFCFQCIQNMATGGDDMLKCPKRDGTQFGKDDIEKMDLNNVVGNLIQLLGKRSDTKQNYY